MYDYVPLKFHYFGCQACIVSSMALSVTGSPKLAKMLPKTRFRQTCQKCLNWPPQIFDVALTYFGPLFQIIEGPSENFPLVLLFSRSFMSISRLMAYTLLIHCEQIYVLCFGNYFDEQDAQSRFWCIINMSAEYTVNLGYDGHGLYRTLFWSRWVIFIEILILYRISSNLG